MNGSQHINAGYMLAFSPVCDTFVIGIDTVLEQQ